MSEAKLTTVDLEIKSYLLEMRPGLSLKEGALKGNGMSDRVDNDLVLKASMQRLNGMAACTMPHNHLF